MKKLFIICTLAVFAACNSNGDAKKTDTDTIQPDTSAIPVSPDTTKMNIPDTANILDTGSTKDTLGK